MYNADKPIERECEDLLGRANFARQLGRAVLTFESKDNIVVGMFGKWGTGKTSIINMAIQEIEKETLEWEDAKKPIVFKFEPWNFSNNDNLVTQFFRLLRAKINRKEHAALKQKIGAALEQYSEAIEFAGLIPTKGPISMLLKISVSFVGKQLQKKYSKTDINEAKESLVDALQKQSKRIIVIIDDIDRLSNEQIRMIFQLVKQVAGFPNITYILSMDKDVVIRALEDIQQCDGTEYLEKIIQIPFNIPELDKKKVQELLFCKLDEILETKKEAEFNQEHWGQIYKTCIEPYIITIRDVNRVINAFRFKYDMVWNEVDFADMLGITSLEVLQPELLKWIVRHKSSICGGSYDYNGVAWGEQDRKKKEYIQELEKIGVEGEKAVEAIAALFPKFDKEINHHYEVIKGNELRGHLRVACAERFNLYFDFNVDAVVIPRSVVKQSISFMSEDELQQFVDEIDRQGNIIDYLEELKGNISEIPYERIGLFLKTLYKHKTRFRGEKGLVYLSLSAESYAESCIYSLIEQLKTTEELYRIYIEIIETGNIEMLRGICCDIYRVEAGYGRLPDAEIDSRRQLLSVEELENVEKAFVHRLKELAGKDRIFEAKSLAWIKLFWEQFDPNECKKYFSEKLQDDIFKLKFICKIASPWTGTGGHGWAFTKSSYDNYVSEEEIYNLIQQYDKTKLKNEFSAEEILILSFFVLNRDKQGGGHASEEEARNLVELWKQSATAFE